MKARWDKDLATLRHEYTSVRNRSINARRNGISRPDCDAQTKVALQTLRSAVEKHKTDVIATALEWASFSGATTLIHFIRDAQFKKMSRLL